MCVALCRLVSSHTLLMCLVLLIVSVCSHLGLGRLEYRHSLGDHRRRVASRSRQQKSVVLLGQFAESGDVLLRNTQSHSRLAMTLRNGFCCESDSFSFSLGDVDSRLIFCLAFQNLGLLLPFCDVDLGKLSSFRVKNHGALSPLRFGLFVHRVANRLGSRNVPNLVTQALDAPRLCGDGNSGDDRRVDRFALFKRLIKGHLPQFRAHRGLCQLRDCEKRIFNPIRSLVWVIDADVQHAVNVKRHVVTGDGVLVGQQQSLLLERMGVSDPIYNWNQKVQTRLQCRVVFPKTLDDPCALLRHDDEPRVPRFVESVFTR
mmetsp:Transcript_67919/g.159812  ORF Transcript_67919/g.159812 Transcript_67919/m.159812 type:complete len:316 (+) Transcript_67919:51-998(+)